MFLFNRYGNLNNNYQQKDFEKAVNKYKVIIERIRNERLLKKKYWIEVDIEGGSLEYIEVFADRVVEDQYIIVAGRSFDSRQGFYKKNDPVP